MNPSGTRRAYAALMLSLVGWSMAPVFIRGLSQAYDPFSQAFIRYLFGAMVLLLITFAGYRNQVGVLLRNLLPVMGIGLINVFQQTTWTLGCYGSKATLAQLVTKLNVVLVIVLSFLLFHEERDVIRSRAYLGGTFLSLVGVAVVLAKDPGSLVPTLDRPTWLLLATAVCWSVYIVWSKHVVMGVHPVPMFGFAAAFSTLGLGVIALIWGEPRCLLQAGSKVTFLAFISGVFPIAMAHSCFHYAQRRLGSAFCSSLSLLIPFLTYIAAVTFLKDEHLLARQWVGGLLLLFGTYLITRAGQRIHQQQAAARMTA